jgi:hypothetical protein
MPLIGLAVALTLSLTLAPLVVEAQQPTTKVPRVRVLMFMPMMKAAQDDFRRGFREQGYVEDRTSLSNGDWLVTNVKTDLRGLQNDADSTSTGDTVPLREARPACQYLESAAIPDWRQRPTRWRADSLCDTHL